MDADFSPDGKNKHPERLQERTLNWNSAKKTSLKRLKTLYWAHRWLTLIRSAFCIDYRVQLQAFYYLQSTPIPVIVASKGTGEIGWLKPEFTISRVTPVIVNFFYQPLRF